MGHESGARELRAREWGAGEWGNGGMLEWWNVGMMECWNDVLLLGVRVIRVIRGYFRQFRFCVLCALLWRFGRTRPHVAPQLRGGRRKAVGRWDEATEG